MHFIEDLLNTPVIVRSADSGVHYGRLVAVEGSAVRLAAARRLWEWKVAGPGISLSEVSVYGVDHAASKITTPVDIAVFGVCEIIPAHGMAQATIEGAPIAQG